MQENEAEEEEEEEEGRWVEGLGRVKMERESVVRERRGERKRVVGVRKREGERERERREGGRVVAVRKKGERK